VAAERPFYVSQDDAPAKREILRAALKLFSARGLAATSIRDIAAETGYTNPALYKHFAGKEELALHLFEACHRRVWALCNAAVTSGKGFDERLERYIGQWLEIVDEHPEVVAFLSDSARVLWPRASAPVKRNTMIGLARSLVLQAPRARRRGAAIDADVAAASLQGTLAELARMLQVGVINGPAVRWKRPMVAFFRKLVA
jgi:TetR/AcrR family transcriptional regulator, repressor of fatR-cypB operon